MDPQVTREPQAACYPADYDPSLNGIGGWLLLLVLIRLLSIYTYVQNISFSMFRDPRFNVFTAVGFGIEFAINVLLSGLILYFLFKQNIVFRILLVIQISVVFVLNILDISSSAYYNDVFKAVFSFASVIIGAAWILYLYRSKRVKNTFIYPKIYEG